MLPFLNADNAFIFRITHIRNIPWILANGLHCRTSGRIDPHFVTIGSPDIIAMRDGRAVPIPPHGTLSDYIPFYFTPKSPMMYNIVTGWGGISQRSRSDIAIMVSSLRDLADSGITALYTDRHAYLSMARFFSSLDHLDEISWGPLQRHDFRRDVDDPEKKEKYQAEALVHRHLPIEHLSEIACYSDEGRVFLEEIRDELGLELTIAVRRSWYL